MENKTVSGVLAISVLLTMLGTYLVTYDGTPYFCEDTQNICVGVRLSSTLKTCYYIDDLGTERGKRCSSLWVPYQNEEIDPAHEVQVYGNGCLHTCVYGDYLTSYDLCTCSNGQYAYAGELI